MLNNLQKYQIKLASNSPRRKELLAGLDVKFDVQIIPNIDESYPMDLPLADVALYIANKKANAYLDVIEDDTLLITADTVVCAEGELLGKPATQDEAKAMLRLLAGKRHEVITGVCIVTKAKQCSFSVSTSVKFAAIDEEDIDYYVSTYKPLDKAGSYGIQEWIGYIAVEEISGSFFNVVGLPVQRLYKELRKF